METSGIERLIGVYDADGSVRGELTVLLDRERLEACDGAPDALFLAIGNGANRRAGRAGVVTVRPR